MATRTSLVSSTSSAIESKNGEKFIRSTKACVKFLRNVTATKDLPLRTSSSAEFSESAWT